MDKFNHAIVPGVILLLLFLFNANITCTEIVLFCIVFGSCIDLNQKLGKLLGHPSHHLRTFIEEPFGPLLVGVPVAFALSRLNPLYAPCVLIPYICHICCDYITIHSVCPLAPFSGRIRRVGWLVAEDKGPWTAPLSERWVTLALAPPFVALAVLKAVQTDGNLFHRVFELYSQGPV
ncbi:hypothetical protein J8273_1736 [Carpediemonas membranifera]|uniref:Uncharacterized protein n=1 Tax=Carpediemonas membranifera TaxID=201153 RepID=A0A8J6AXQ3_9EUKA|nr:hypothetical protein J8273_1736 [Carpediemonas membranifera]|eukprot:KAG9396718.1 hypothetical protein J8273_1736 [Carpediemonas membranifera]